MVQGRCLVIFLDATEAVYSDMADMTSQVSNATTNSDSMPQDLTRHPSKLRITSTEF